MTKAEPIESADLFLQGQRDCMEGIPHKPNMGRDYDRGYAVEYEREQIMSENSRRRAKRWD